jgi:putative membrane protein
MVKDHKEDIDEFKKEAQDGKDPELKAFAAKHVPILEHHLQMANRLTKRLINNHLKREKARVTAPLLWKYKEI